MIQVVGYDGRMKPSRKIYPYLILVLGIVGALYLSAETAKTAKRLQQGRFDDQQRLNAQIKQIHIRQDELGCTLESFQRRHPELFEGAAGPIEVKSCRDQRVSVGGTEQSVDSTD